MVLVTFEGNYAIRTCKIDRIMTLNSHSLVANHQDYTLILPEKHRVPIDKYALVPEQLLYLGIVEENEFFSPDPVSKEILALAHQADYLNRALKKELTPKEARRIGYPYDDLLIRRERRIVQGTLTAAEIALKKGIAFNVAGGTHHAGSDWGEGFCLFNDVATVALYLLETRQVEKILVIDLDVHQGNGTAEILQEEPRAFTFSMHAEKNFPFRKEKSDLDIGLADGTEGEEYLNILQDTLDRLFQQEQPELVCYLAGADVLGNDKLGRLNLTKEDCKLRDRMVFAYCKEHGVPVQVGTAGGYSEKLGDIVDVHCQTFEEGIAMLLE